MNKKEALMIIIRMKNSAEKNKDNYSVYGGDEVQPNKDIEALNVAIEAIKHCNF